MCELAAADRLRFVLMEPAGALNVGSIARVLKNFGFQRLVLVAPRCDPWGEESRQMAVHAQDILDGAQRVDSLGEALEGCHVVLATTGRDHDLDRPLHRPSQAFPWLRHQLTTPGLEAALVFGREDRGLTRSELHQAHRLVGISTSDRYPSLNLAQALGICCYQLHQDLYPDPPQESLPEASPWPNHPSAIGSIAPPNTLVLSRPSPPAPLEFLEGYYQHLERILLRIGYLYPHTAASRLDKFRHIYQRADLSSQEVSLLRGVLRQTEWALGQDRPSSWVPPNPDS